MPSRSLLTLTVAFVLAVATFTVVAGAQEPPPNPADPRIVSGGAQRALDTARARWRAAKVRSYDWEVRRSCFCPVTGWRLVKVRNTLPARSTKADVQDIATVPRLFRVIQHAIHERAHSLTVVYGARGVPARVSIDAVQYLADEEQYLSTRRLRRR